MANSEYPKGLFILIDRLNFACSDPEQIGPYYIYLVDLADWNLVFSDETPVIWIKSDVIQSQDPKFIISSVQDVIRSKQWINTTVLVFIDGDISLLSPLKHSFMPSYVIFDQASQDKIEKSASPTAVALDIFLSQMSRSQLSPYETSRPAVGSKFFGRQYEINSVLRFPERDYIFLGNQRIGKSSLLFEIMRRLSTIERNIPENKQPWLYLDCSLFDTKQDFYEHIVSQLKKSELQLLVRRPGQSTRYEALMFQRIADLHGIPYVTYFVDEMDKLLTKLDSDWSLIEVMRSVSAAGYARFVIAGYKKVMEGLLTSMPFYNSFEIRHLGPLLKSEVSQMISKPFSDLRIRIKDQQSFINRIYQETAGHPSIVQYYCKTLLDEIDDKGLDVISERELNSVYSNSELRHFIVETHFYNADKVEKLIIAALLKQNCGINQNRYTKEMAMQTLVENRVRLDLDTLLRAFDNLEIAGTLKAVGKSYEFSVPLFKKIILDNENVDLLFKLARDDVFTAKLGEEL